MCADYTICGIFWQDLKPSLPSETVIEMPQKTLAERHERTQRQPERQDVMPSP